jgi:hypothetical protein
LKEAIGSVPASYPVPFLATLLCLIGLALAGLALTFQDAERWMMPGVAGLMFLVAIATIIKAVFVNPALLRLEPHIFS